MPEHLDYNDPACKETAAELLRRHDLSQPEANITSAVRDFLIAARLARSDEIVEENPPAQGSRRAVNPSFPRRACPRAVGGGNPLPGRTYTAASR